MARPPLIDRCLDSLADELTPIRAAQLNLDNLSWRQWLAKYFPRAAFAPMPDGGRHARLWEWFEALQPGVRTKPRAEFWPRGGGKSSTVELGVVRLGTRMVEHDGQARPARQFVLYVSGTQDQANQHVEAIRQKFEDLGVGRKVGKYGHSKGWKVDLLRTETGFNVLALGLDAASRGVKLDDFRPDLIVLDDIDSRHDKPEAVKKKIQTLTESILPTGAPDCAVLFIQNLIHSESIASKLENGTADFLLTRERSQAEPAVIGLEYEVVDGVYKITGGVATWAGQDLETCEYQMNRDGRASFLREAQHETDESDEGLWQAEWIEDGRIARVDLPPLERVVVGVDPSGGAGQWGIVAKGRAGHGERAHYYVLEDATPADGTPTGISVDEAIDCYVRNEADCFALETNFGGDMAETILRRAAADKGVAIRIKTVVASRGKQLRAEPAAELAEKGYEHHVGVWPELEKEKTKWQPSDKNSPNRLDADVWATTELMGKTARSGSANYDERMKKPEPADRRAVRARR